MVLGNVNNAHTVGSTVFLAPSGRDNNHGTLGNLKFFCYVKGNLIIIRNIGDRITDYGENSPVVRQTLSGITTVGNGNNRNIGTKFTYSFGRSSRFGKSNNGGHRGQGQRTLGNGYSDGIIDGVLT